MFELTCEERSRYDRHLTLPQFGSEGQTRIKNSRVLCIGVGGLGSAVLTYLAAAGVGTLGIVDFDVVDETNLQRQVIHRTDDVQRPKVLSARDRLKDLNPNINVETFQTRLDSKNALDIFKDFDLVADGTDNFAARYLINDTCVRLGKPNVYGAVLRFEGQASVFHHRGGPCLRCLYPEPPDPVSTVLENGVLGTLAGMVGCIQASEVIKILLGNGTTLSGRLLLLDVWKMTFREMKLNKDPCCPICSKHRATAGLTPSRS